MVVVIGAGITGASTAFYLCQQNQYCDVTIIDAVGPATCSKAAAFLSESWGDGTKTEKLHRRSFQMHLDLAEELGLSSIRQIPAYTLREDRYDSEKDGEEHVQPNSLVLPWNHQFDKQELVKLSQISGRHALVDPRELVTSLIDASVKNGATLEVSSVAGLDMDEDGMMARGIVLENGEVKQLDHGEPVVIAMGPWTSRVEDWLQIPMPIDGVLSTSFVFEDLHLFDSPSAMFCEEDLRGCHLEIFQRVNNSVYVSGIGNSKPMRASVFRGPGRPVPGNEVPSRPDPALKSLEELNLIQRDTVLTDVRACIRPMSPDGLPVVGQLGNTNSNIYVASGGGQWGITWGLFLAR